MGQGPRVILRALGVSFASRNRSTRDQPPLLRRLMLKIPKCLIQRSLALGPAPIRPMAGTRAMNAAGLAAHSVVNPSYGAADWRAIPEQPLGWRGRFWILKRHSSTARLGTMPDLDSSYEW